MPGGVHASGLQGGGNPRCRRHHAELMQRFDVAGYVYRAAENTHPDWAGNPPSHYERMMQPGASFIRASFNPEGAGCVMAEMLDEVGVDVCYGTRFADVLVEKSGGSDGALQAVVVEAASGRQAITAQAFIDGSGTADVVARGGAICARRWRSAEGAHWDGVNRPIPGGLLSIMSGMDFAQTARYQRSASDPQLALLIAEASAAGDLPPGLNRPRKGSNNVYGEHYIGYPMLDTSPMLSDDTYIIRQNVAYEGALHMDDSAADHSRATSALRRFVDAEARVLRKCVPGFENALRRNVGRYVGIRDGRHLMGEHVFSRADARSSRQFHVAVTPPMTKTLFWDSLKKYTFQIP